MSTQTLLDLAEECRSLMRTARETASRLEFIADQLLARAAEDDAPRQANSGDGETKSGNGRTKA